MTRAPIALEEHYHCYNRGVEKRLVFENTADYERFLQLLFLCNSAASVRRDDHPKASTRDIVITQRESPIVAVLAYCLMPNHFHLVLKEVTEGGISKFMHKLNTAYTMYFNAKYRRAGNLFLKPFRSKHLSNDLYLQHAHSYVLLNPAEIFEPSWKDGVIQNMELLLSQLLEYRYSSLQDFYDRARPEKAIIDASASQILRRQGFEEMVQDAASYYSEAVR